MKVRCNRCWAAFLLLGALLALSSTRSRAETARHWPHFSRAQSQREGYGGVVRAAQYLLRAHGYQVVADGMIGAQTQSAIKGFQRSRRLRASGVLTDATWERLVVPVRRGSRGQALRGAQLLLSLAGYDVKQDGIFGRGTEAAVRGFQASHGLPVDGVVGAYTWCALSEGTASSTIRE